MPQVSASIPKEQHDEVVKIAEKERRSISEVVAFCVEQSLKERERQRIKNSKKNKDIS